MKLGILLLVLSWDQALKEQWNAEWLHSMPVFLVLLFSMHNVIIHCSIILCICKIIVFMMQKLCLSEL